MARSLAGKLSIAVRTDFFGKQNIAAELQKGLNLRLQAIQKKRN